MQNYDADLYVHFKPFKGFFSLIEILVPVEQGN